MQIGKRIFKKCNGCLGSGEMEVPSVQNVEKTVTAPCTFCHGTGKKRVQGLRKVELKPGTSMLLFQDTGYTICCSFSSDDESVCSTSCAAFRQKENEKGTIDYACCERLTLPIGELICEEINEAE